jgi:hypothetical protein
MGCVFVSSRVTASNTKAPSSSVFYVLGYLPINSALPRNNLSNDDFASNATTGRYCMAILVCFKSQSRSYVMTDCQSASLSWSQASIWSPKPEFCYFETVTGLLMWLSLKRGRDCCLRLLMDFASVVIPESESSWTHDHVLLSQFRDLTNLEE